MTSRPALIDERPYGSRLRATWTPQRSASGTRPGTTDRVARDVAANLVELTATFRWAA